MSSTKYPAVPENSSKAIVSSTLATMKWSVLDGCSSRQHAIKSHLFKSFGPPGILISKGLLARKSVVIEHHGFQTICPTGQLLIEPSSAPCPGHFMAGRHRECLRCRSNNNWLASSKLWLLTFVRRFLCSRVAANVMPTEWLSGLIHLPYAVSIPHGIETMARDSESPHSFGPPRIIFQGRLVTTKGLPVLLEAASILRLENRAFELLVIGDGPERIAIEEFAKKLQLSSRVHFL